MKNDENDRDLVGRVPSRGVWPDDFDPAPFGRCGGLVKARHRFGEQLPILIDEPNEVLPL